MVEMISEEKGVKHIVSIIREQGLKELSIILDKFEKDLHPLGYGVFMDALAYVIENDMDFCKSLDYKISEFMESIQDIIENILNDDKRYEYEDYDKDKEIEPIILDEGTLSYLKYRFDFGYNSGNDLKHEGLNEICNLCNLRKQDKSHTLFGITERKKSKDGSDKILEYNYLEGVTYIVEGESFNNNDIFLIRQKNEKTSFGFEDDITTSFVHNDLFSEEVLKQIKETFRTITDIGCKIRAKVTVCDYILQELKLRITDYAKIVSA